jgi:GNAT superfamily N-acetyltransferase
MSIFTFNPQTTNTMQCRETTYYLEMTDPDQLVPARDPVEDLEIRKLGLVVPEVNRFFYAAVGGQWYWVDRLGWTREQWQSYLDQPGVETWMAQLRAAPVGYFELREERESGVEIVMFGLLPDFTGQGLGGALLTFALRRAWAKGTHRVWLHTSSLDHPRALDHYQARGLRLVDQVVADKELPDTAPGFWPVGQETAEQESDSLARAHKVPGEAA